MTDGQTDRQTGRQVRKNGPTDDTFHLKTLICLPAGMSETR